MTADVLREVLNGFRNAVQGRELLWDGREFIMLQDLHGDVMALKRIGPGSRIIEEAEMTLHFPPSVKLTTLLDQSRIG